MSRSTLGLEDHIRTYLQSVSVRDDDVRRDLRARTASLDNAAMQISPEQGSFMTLLVELMGARRALEVGTFTGYSALSIAAGLPEDGKLVACDVSEEYTTIAREYWARAGLEDRIDLRLGPATDTLAAMIEAGEAGSYDFAFIDADKSNYDRYYEQALVLLRTGGLIAVDNVLWGGSVANPEDDRESTVAIRNLNAKLHADERVTVSMVPIGDGLTLCRKRV